MALPQIPYSLRNQLPPWLYNWWQDFSKWLLNRLETNGDVTLAVKRKGIIMTNAAGTITKRIRLNDAGTDILVEDV